MKTGTTLKASKLKYLEDCDVLKDWYHLLADKAEEKSVKIDLNAITEISREELIKLAMRIVNLPYQDDRYFIQALLSAYLYLFEDAKAENDVKA